MIMKKSVFEINTKSHLEKDLFFDEGVDIARYDVVKYPALQKLYEKMLSFYWTPDEIDVTKDKLPELKNIGLVTASTWIDYDGDSWEDLVIVGEWMPIRFFKNNQGTFKEDTKQVFKSDQNGWWFSIEKGDFDNDGDQDLVVGNLGTNYKYQASVEKPFSIYLNDFDKNEVKDIVLSYSTGSEEYPVRGRQCSSEQMPAIKKKFKNYDAFASASLKDIYTDQMLDNSLKYEIKQPLR